MGFAARCEISRWCLLYGSRWIAFENARLDSVAEGGAGLGGGGEQAK